MRADARRLPSPSQFFRVAPSGQYSSRKRISWSSFVDKRLFKSSLWRKVLATGLVLLLVLLLLVVTPASDAHVEFAILHYDDDCGSGVLCGGCNGAW